MFASRAAILRPHPSGAFAVVIAANGTNLNLRTVSNAQGYTGGDCTITILTAVDVGSTTTATAALVTGTWPAGAVVTLINKGTITGKDGGGGAGGDGGLGDNIAVAGDGVAGGTGGTALNATANLLKVDNSLGTIRGGKGGGGGGGGGGGALGGTGGLGQQGGQGGTGGTGGAGFAGGAGTVGPDGATAGTGGTGGAAGSYGSAGFSGGAGTAGVGSTAGHVGGNGAGGGAGGNAVQGNSNITWLANGTRLGGIV